MIFVTRKQWGARPPRFRVPVNFTRPPTGHWNGPTIRVRGRLNWDHKYCSSLVRGIQNYHMDEKNWSDIAYNFLVCPHRHVFEGRGKKYQNGANGTRTGNKTSPAICFLAGELNPFTEGEQLAFVECVQFIDSPASGALGHRDWKQTKCPGDVRYKWIKAGMPVSYPELQRSNFMFESHEDRVEFVKKSYRNIAKREPGQNEVDFWVYLIALNPRHAMDLIVDLHGE